MNRHQLAKLAAPVLLAVAAAHELQAQQLTAIDVVAPRNWPYALSYHNDTVTDQLLVVREDGNALEVRQTDGGVSRLPWVTRAGLHFMYVKAGTTARYDIAPYYQHPVMGGFSYGVLPLENETLQAAGMTLSAAALLTGSSADAAMACQHFETVAAMPGLPREWHDLADLLLTGCSDAATLQSADAASARIAGLTSNPFGVRSYVSDWIRGRYWYRRDQYAQAVAYYQSALDKLKADQAGAAIGAHVLQIDEAALFTDLALNLVILSYNSEGADKQNHLASAARAIEAAEVVGEAYRDHKLLAETHDTLAALNYVKGNDAGVIEHLLVAKENADLLGRPSELIAILGSLGDYYAKWGQLQKALAAYLEELQLVEQGASGAIGGDVYHNLATLYRTLGDLSRAQEFAERASEIYTQAGIIYRAKLLNFELATILEERGDLPTALALLEDELSYFATLENPWQPLRLKAQAALSRTEAKLGNFSRAFALSDELFEHQAQLRSASTVQTVPIYINHANLLVKKGQVSRALSLLDEMIALNTLQPADRIDLLAAELDIFQQQGDTTQANALADSTFALIESQQMQLESSRLGPYWNGKMQGIYMRHAEYLLTLASSPDSQQLAFAVVERARATNLRLRRQQMALAAIDHDRAATARWQQLLEDVETGARDTSSATTMALERRITLESERFFASYGNAMSLQQPSVLALDAIASGLPADTFALNFVVGSHRIWRYELDNAGWRVTDLGDIGTINTAIDSALLDTSRAGNNGENLQLLSRLLLKDLHIPPAVTRIVISPAGALSNVPFAALRYNDNYLMDIGTLVQAPSFSEYFSAGSRADQDYTVELAVFADPNFGDIRQPLMAEVDSVALRGWSDTLERLPATAQEAAALATFYPTGQRLILTGEQATQQRLFSAEVRNARIIHLATHGYFDEQLPELVGLALSKADEDDGFVSMAEISAMRFNADLVVISACSTAQGEHVPGEGNMSLARTFLAQGVNSVISTLWPVSDRATALFMKEFYRALNENGSSYAEALARAQTSLRSSSTYRNPFYWAAFTLSSMKADF